MKRFLVYDLPTRFFHWTFASLFLIAFFIAKAIGDESPWFNYHSLAGLTLGFLVLLRIAWGLIGTKHARFTNFALNPNDLINYFKGLLSGSKKRWAGHNPASSWAAITMMVLALCLSATGYLMISSESKEAIGLSMIDGKKSNIAKDQIINQNKGAIAFVFLLLVVGFGMNLLKNYDSEKQTLKLFGNTLNFSKVESDKD